MTSLLTPPGADLLRPTLAVLPPVAPLLSCPTCEHRPSPHLPDGQPVCSAPDADEFDLDGAVECGCGDPWHVANRRRPQQTRGLRGRIHALLHRAA